MLKASEKIFLENPRKEPLAFLEIEMLDVNLVSIMKKNSCSLEFHFQQEKSEMLATFLTAVVIDSKSKEFNFNNPGNSL